MSSRTPRRPFASSTRLLLAAVAFAGVTALGSWAAALDAAAAGDWTFRAAGGPADLAAGLAVTGDWSGGRVDGYPAGMWQFFEPSTGTMVYGFCLDLGGSFTFGAHPFSDGGQARLRGYYGPVAYLLQKAWPNQPNASDPGAVRPPTVATGHPDDWNVDAAVIQAAIWHYTNGFDLEGCSGCDVGELLAAYRWVLSEAETKYGWYCYNHAALLDAPGDGTTVAWGYGPGQAEGYSVTAAVTGDCGDRRPVPGAFAGFTVSSPSGGRVSIDGGPWAGSVTACCAPTDAAGRLTISFRVSQPCRRCTAEADVTVIVWDTWQGAILRVDRGGGSQPIGASAYSRGGRGAYVLRQETRHYYFLDPEPDLGGGAWVTDLTTGASGTEIAANPGDTVRWSWLLDNTAGTAPADGIEVHTPMGTGGMELLQSVSPDARGAATRSDAADGGAPGLIWEVGQLATGGTDQVSFTAQVPWWQPPGTAVFDSQGLYTSDGAPDFHPNPTRITVRYNPPAEPAGAGVSCDGGSDSSAVLTWLPVQGAVGYHIYQRSPGQPTIVGATDAGTTSWTAKDLSPGIPYTWAVTAVSDGGESDPSQASPTNPAFDSGTCGAPPPPVIRAVERCQAGGAGAHLDWTAPPAGPAVVRYVVTADRGGHRWTITGADTATWTVTDQDGASRSTGGDPGNPSLDVDGLLNVTEYTFTIQAFTSSRSSLVSDPSNAITPTCSA